MKKANDMLGELKCALKSPVEINDCFHVKDHPALQLDEYMKEQYFTMLFSTLINSEAFEKEAFSYLIGIAKQAEFEIEPEKIVKSVFAFDDNQIHDCAVSFRDEEIKYLLGFELYAVSAMQKESEETLKSIQKLYQAMEISQNEYDAYQLIYKVLISGNLQEYSKKENYPHSHIMQCYFSKLDFDKERVLVVSNCIKDVRAAGSDRNFITTVAFAEAHFITDYTPGEFEYVEKGTALGHFIAMIGGFALCVDSDRWDKMEEDEKRLITPKFKDYDKLRSLYDRDYYKDNTYEVCDILAEKSGVFYFIYNGIGEYNDPFSVISHPLDDEEKIRKYLDNCIDLSREKNGE